MKNCPVNSKFKKLSKKHFKSESDFIDFMSNEEATKNINNWILSKTNLKLEDLFSANTFNEDTRLTLVNTIFFKGKFSIPFDPNETYRDNFFINETESIEVDYMSITVRNS